MLFRNPLKILSVLLLFILFADCKKDKQKNVDNTIKPKLTTTDTTYDFSFSGEMIAGDTIHFASTAPADSALKWQFGDGATSSSPFPIHVYTAAGSYTVALVVGRDTAHTIRKTINIIADTTYDFSYSGNHYLGGTLYFSSKARHALKYLWSFGDGTTSSEAAPQHVYLKEGLYTAALVINDDSVHAIRKGVSVGLDSVLLASVAGTRNYQYTQRIVNYSGSDTSTYPFGVVSRTITVTNPYMIAFGNIDLFLNTYDSGILYFSIKSSGSGSLLSSVYTLNYNTTTKQVNVRLLSYYKNVYTEDIYTSI